MTTIRKLPESAAHTPGLLRCGFAHWGCWQISSEARTIGELLAYAGLGGREVALNAEQEANARRIIACWNACQGIPTEILEVQNPGGALHGMTKELQSERDRLRTLNAELVKALERYMSGHPCGASQECPTKNEAITVLAKAKVTP